MGEVPAAVAAQPAAARRSSQDGGRTWGSVRSTGLPNPSAGIDGVALREDCKVWKAAALLEHNPGSSAEYSYPAAIQTADGRVHVTYTWDRKSIRHVVIEPERLVLRDLVDGKWPE